MDETRNWGGVDKIQFGPPPQKEGHWILDKQYIDEYIIFIARNPYATRAQFDSWMIDHYATYNGPKIIK